MIMISLRNKSAFWILFSLQAAFVLGNDSWESARIELKNTFGYDFGKICSFGAKFVWRINSDNEKFSVEDYSEGFRTFKSTETYIIFARRWTFYIHLYYWAGKETSLKDKKNVAKYAIMFHHFFHKIWDLSYKVFFSREYETLETESFLHILHELNGTSQPESRFSAYCNKYFPLNGHNLYMIKGGETTRVKKVTFDLRWIKPNICLIIDPTGDLIGEFYPATVWCGKETNEKVHRRAIKFAKKFSSSSNVNVITGVSIKYKILIELLEDNRNNRPSDVDTSADDKIDNDKFIKNRDESVKLFKLFMNYPHGRKEVKYKPICTDIFYNTVGTFLFDSDSIAGIFCLIGIRTDLEIKIWVIQYAEHYLNSKVEILRRPIPMRIMTTVSTDFIFDFMINIIDLPFNTLPNGDDEIW